MQEEEIKGKWESLPDSPIFVVHAALLHTGKVLLFSGRAEKGESDPNYRLESKVWDPQRGTFTTQEYEDDLFCSGHAFLSDGRLCVVGGANYGMVRATNLFNPITESWTKVADMEKARWYSTVLTLADGRIMAASGMFEDGIIEIYDPDE